MNTVGILLISRDPALIVGAGEAVTASGSCRLEHAPTDAAATAMIRSGGTGLVLLHLASRRDEAAAAWLLEQAADREIPTVVIVEEDDPAIMVRMIRAGAADCLQRPLNITRLALLVEILTMRARLCPAKSRSIQSRDAADLEQWSEFLVVSPRMVGLVEQIRKVAQLDSSILLTGETGTGKTTLARYIHGLSPRRGEPFLAINCGALSPTLIESEMFGHVRGAFTGADRNREGKLSQVANGTLLLDEIDSLPLAIQAKLLRAVEERAFEPVGSNETHSMRARLIVASNRSLEEEVAGGRFRSDLYFRLNVLGFHLPPLRDRREAIDGLVKKYLADFRHYHGGKVAGIAPAALTALMAHQWPGNIRELRNVVERAVAVCNSRRIELTDLPPAFQYSAAADENTRVDAYPAPNQLAAARGHAECERLTTVLRRLNNNRSHAALELGISRVTLYKKLRKYGLA